MEKYTNQYKKSLPKYQDIDYSKLIIPRLNELTYMETSIVVNTNEFQKEADHFRKYGYYTDAPIGSQDYDDYWDEQERRCIEGCTVGGLWITGKHYFYLNFQQIRRIPSRQYLEYHPKASPNTKTDDFPSFWEIDLYWWYTKELMEWNALNRIRNCHLSCVKTRRGGFSFKEAVEGIYNYTFIPYSKSQYFASTEKYLTTDGIFNKVEAALDFLDTHTCWRKNRLIDRKFHKQSGWLEGQVAYGFKSELIATVLDKPDKARGGDSLKIALEEGGSFPDVLTAYQILLPQVTQGGVTTGFITVFGTGGNKDEKGIEGLTEFFYNPDPYGMITFKNKWDEDILDTECGFFVPATAVMEQHMSTSGILDVENATKELLEERRHLENAGDKNAYSRHCAEHPLKPAEALVRSMYNVFDTTLVKRQLTRLEIGKVWNPAQTGYLDYDGQTLTWKPSNLNPLLDWPIQAGGVGTKTPLEGAITVYQHPVRGEDNQVYSNLYFITVDPYAQDEAEHSKSVGCAYVWKRTNNVSLDIFCDNIVASYVGRPSTTDKFWDKVFKLAIYYNCVGTLQSEILGGGQLGINFAKQHKLERYLAFKFETLDPREFKVNVKGARTYFTTVTKDMKDVGLELLKEWSNEVVTVHGDKFVSRIETIYDIGLLREMLNFVPNDDKKNFDRISSCILMPFQKREMLNLTIKSKNASNNKVTQFFKRKLF